MLLLSNRICQSLSYIPCSAWQGGEAGVSAGHKKNEKIDPHDVVKPEHYFNSEAEAVGVVYQLFLRKLKETVPQKLTKEERQLKLERQIEAAKKLLAANGIQSSGLWSMDDIIEIARELKRRCSKKDARTILAKIEEDFNAELGITWQSVEQCVEDYFQEKKPKNKNGTSKE